MTDTNGEGATRQILFSAASAKTIREAWAEASRARAEADRLRRRAQELTDVALEAMGCDLGEAADEVGWNVVDGEEGELIATFGPKVRAPGAMPPDVGALVAAIVKAGGTIVRSEPAGHAD